MKRLKPKKSKIICTDCLNHEIEGEELFTKEGSCEYCGDLCDDCIDDHERYLCEHKRAEPIDIDMREDRDAR